MQQGWIWLTVLAALMQAVRTAAQKVLAERISTMSATYVRALLGLPVMLVYLAVVTGFPSHALPPVGWDFLGSCLVAAATQNSGTAALLHLYKLRNFAVANQLARTNLVFTAVLGSAFFSEVISPLGWVAIGLTLSGAVALTFERQGLGLAHARAGSWRDLFDWPSVRTGLFIGLMFGVCNLAIREATLSLHTDDALVRGAVTVTTVTVLQVASLGLWLVLREPAFIAGIRNNLALSSFVGLTSALGSIGWFAAFAMTNASYVMAVGQIEVVFGLLISVLYFKERLTNLDFVGIAIVVSGIMLFRMAA